MKQNTASNNPLQSPFRQEKLLTQSGFISFCDENGMRTDKEELEYFEREGVLYPAVMVNRGYGRVWLIKPDSGHENAGKYTWGPEVESMAEEGLLDEKPYYMADSFHTGGLSWLKDCEVLYPADLPDSLAVRYEPEEKASSSIIVERPGQLGNLWEPFYSPSQVYALREIRKYRTVTIRNAALFTQDQESGEKLAKFFKGNDLLKEIVAKAYLRDAVLIKIERLYDRKENELDAHFAKVGNELDRDKRLISAELNAYEGRHNPLWKEHGQKIVEEAGVGMEELRDWRRDNLLGNSERHYLRPLQPPQAV